MGPLEVDNVTYNSAELTWKPPQSDGGKPVTSYIIEYRLSSRTFYTKADSVSGSTLKFNVTKLNEDSLYYFRVIAVNDEGQSQPLETSDTTKLPKRIGNFFIQFFPYSVDILTTECSFYFKF